MGPKPSAVVYFKMKTGLISGVRRRGPWDAKFWEQLHNSGPLLKVPIFSGSFGSAVDKRTNNNLYRSIYLVARLIWLGSG